MTSASSTLKREQRTILRLTVDVQNDRVTQSVVREVRFDCRALRILNDTERLVSVHFTRRVSTKRIEEWINECQCQGKVLDVDGKAMRFSWLGYTESQLKEGSLFLLYEDDSWTVERLFEKLGNVKDVYRQSGYGKFCARLGLSFSTTVPAMDIPHEMVASISDKPAEDGTLFTDGCGLIRDSCASEVCSALGVPEDTSVFQIRRGGVKGLLVRYPDEVFDLLCPGPNMKVAIRPSMIKYQGGPTVLEVHNVSRRPRSARLNKHFIILLLTLRVPLKAFEDLLRTNLEFIAGVMTSRQRALDALDASLDSDESGFDQELYELLLAGFQLSEPHVKCLLERLQKRSLDSLRKKLNIRVKNSFYLFGVCDERGVLSEGEVYINISGDVKLGTVLVGRNPAYSTSVLRVLQAVNRPELAHCHNCIVFASQSTRSETTKMQGDVDGDYYWVTTDPTLIPPRTSEPPAAIPPRASRKSDYVNEKADGLKVFMRLRRNFTLSSASKAWMDNVTLTPDLADAPLARSLARIVEQAVDLVKSGGNARMLAAELDTILGTTGQESAKARMTYPQWQDPIAHLIATVPASPQGKQVSFMVDPDVDLSSIVGRDRWEALLKEAEPVMRRFNSALANAIKADEELAEDGDEFDRDVLRQTDLVKDKFLKHHFPPDADILTLLASYAKASAWYVAGYTRGANGRGGEAFSWLPYRYLAHIKAHACSRNGLPLAVGPTSRPLNALPIAEDIPGEPRACEARSQVGDVPYASLITIERGRTMEECSSSNRHAPAQTSTSYRDDVAPTQVRSASLVSSSMSVPPRERSTRSSRSSRRSSSQSSIYEDAREAFSPEVPRAMSISAYTATESISSVRHVPAPHTTADPLSRASSHTLVEDSGYRAPHYHLAATAPVARLAPPSYMSAATVSAGRVARSNNKPKEPQDTQVQCVGNSWKHPRWTVQHANGQQRTYFCWDCGAEVKEKIDHVQGKWLQSGVSRRDVSMARHIAVS